MRTIFYTLLSGILLGFVSCGKNAVMDVNYRIVTYTQAATIDKPAVYADVAVYCFFSDTATFSLRNYDDALAGRLRSRYNAEATVDHDMVGEYISDTVVFKNITHPKVTMVICDKLNPIYGIKVINLPEESFTVRETFTFRLFKYEKYTEGQWSMYNGLTPPPPPDPEDPDQPEDPENPDQPTDPETGD